MDRSVILKTEMTFGVQKVLFFFEKQKCHFHMFFIPEVSLPHFKSFYREKSRKFNFLFIKLVGFFFKFPSKIQ